MLEGLYKIQIGKETTLGTEVNATTKLRTKGFFKDESVYEYPEEDVGIAGGVGRLYTPDRQGTFEVDEMEATFEQLGYFLNSGIVGVAGVADGAGTDFIYTHPFPYDTNVTPYYYTVESGDEQQAIIMTGCFTEELTITGKAFEAWKMKPTMRGQPRDTTTFTAGLAIPTVEDILMGNTKLYINAVSSPFGTTQKTGTFSAFELKVSKVHVVKPITDGTGVYYTATKWNTTYEVELKYTTEHDAVAVAEDAARVARTPRAIRIIGTGAAFGTPGTTYSVKTAILDICGTYSAPMTYKAEDGNIMTEHTLKGHYNATLGNRGKIVVANELAALP